MAARPKEAQSDVAARERQLDQREETMAARTKNREVVHVTKRAELKEREDKLATREKAYEDKRKAQMQREKALAQREKDVVRWEQKVSKMLEAAEARPKQDRPLGEVPATSSGPAAVTLMLVSVPAKVGVGEQMVVKTPAGQQFTVIVPAGATPGSQFQIAIPDFKDTPAVATSPASAMATDAAKTATLDAPKASPDTVGRIEGRARMAGAAGAALLAQTYPRPDAKRSGARRVIQKGEVVLLKPEPLPKQVHWRMEKYQPVTQQKLFGSETMRLADWLAERAKAAGRSDLSPTVDG